MGARCIYSSPQRNTESTMTTTATKILVLNLSTLVSMALFSLVVLGMHTAHASAAQY